MINKRQKVGLFIQFCRGKITNGPILSLVAPFLFLLKKCLNTAHCVSFVYSWYYGTAMLSSTDKPGKILPNLFSMRPNKAHLWWAMFFLLLERILAREAKPQLFAFFFCGFVSMALRYVIVSGKIPKIKPQIIKYRLHQVIVQSLDMYLNLSFS